MIECGHYQSFGLAFLHGLHISVVHSDTELAAPYQSILHQGSSSTNAV
jgi:hypothetical protein